MHQGMDFTKLKHVSCGVWHQRISRTFFKSNRLRGGASVDRIWSRTSHRCSIRLRSGEFGGQGKTFNYLFLKPSWTIVAVWQGALSCWKRPRPSGSTIAMRGCMLSATVLRWVIHIKCNIHLNAKTQAFQAENCPEHKTASACILLPSLPLVNDAHSHPPDLKENVIHQTRQPTSIAPWYSPGTFGSGQGTS